MTTAQELHYLRDRVKSLEDNCDFLRKTIALSEEHLAYIDKAWSILHPHDVAWMRDNPPGNGRDWHNALIYSFRRPLPNGVCLTGLESQYVAPPSPNTQLVSVLESVLHQLSTDSDLADRVSAPERYRHLERLVRQALASADPTNPQLRYEDAP